jgi:hypothetical protein
MVFLDPSRADFVLDRTRHFIRGSLAPRSALAGLRAFAGPTFIASVAYLDPGNFATNITAGAQHGYQLLWVVLCWPMQWPCCFRRYRPSSASSLVAASRVPATTGCRRL